MTGRILWIAKPVNLPDGNPALGHPPRSNSLCPRRFAEIPAGGDWPCERFCNFRSSLRVAIAVKRTNFQPAFRFAPTHRMRTDFDVCSKATPLLPEFPPRLRTAGWRRACALGQGRDRNRRAAVHFCGSRAVARDHRRPCRAGAIKLRGEWIAHTRSTEERTQRCGVYCAPGANPLRLLDDRMSGHPADGFTVPARK